MPEHAKDVMLAVLGSSVGLAGLLLVFCGFMFGQAAIFPPATTDDAMIDRYKNAGRQAIWPFLMALGVAVAATIWLAWPALSHSAFYVGVVAAFVVLLIVTAIYGAVVIKFYL